MEKTEILIIGGGASGLMLSALCLPQKAVLLERGQRVGKKLSATGNGQGNLTNVQMDESHYFSSSKQKEELLSRALSLFGKDETIAFFEKLGGLFFADGKGRVYPTGRQASALTAFHQYDGLANVSKEKLRILNQHFGGNEVVKESTFRLF